MFDETFEGSSMEHTHPTVHPNEFDVIITDIGKKSIASIGRYLEIENLSPATGSVAFPVNGTMHGAGLRIFFGLVATTKKSSVNVLFLMDTSSPSTHLCQDTLEALGFTESISGHTIVNIHGTTVQVYPSRGQFKNVNLLGQDYLRQAQLHVVLNYADFTAVILKVAPMGTM